MYCGAQPAYDHAICEGVGGAEGRREGRRSVGKGGEEKRGGGVWK